jgi:ribbon-helix-helix CopG family protein
MRTTITLPDTLLKNAKRRAAQRGVTLSALLEDALRGHLAGQPLARHAPFRLYTVRGRLVNPHLDLDRTSALFVADDEAEFARGRS